jgi:hypothetical protein
MGVAQDSASNPRGGNGMIVQEPTRPGYEHWYETGDQARAAFDRRLSQLRQDDSQAQVVRVSLVVDGAIADEEYVVHRPSRIDDRRHGRPC